MVRKLAGYGYCHCSACGVYGPERFEGTNCQLRRNPRHAGFVFFGSVIIAAALYDGAYFKALGLAWFSCLVWFAFLIVTGSCVRYIRYGDTLDTADTAAGAA